MQQPSVILASQSPRRKELLKRLESDFDLLIAHSEELLSHPDGPMALAEENALLKVKAVAHQKPDAWIIGSDTVVALKDELFAKPEDKESAKEMLSKLSGKIHQVYTGVALIRLDSKQEEKFVEKSDVRFFELNDPLIERYLEAYDATSFAGGYPIQHVLGDLVSGFSGSYTNIVGLPVERLAIELKRLGIIA